VPDFASDVLVVDSASSLRRPTIVHGRQRRRIGVGMKYPYCDKLRRAHRADISDEVWATINSNVSRPLPRPSTGKVAIKVINHYGDEVLKVFEIIGQKK
jgi:hypothetical protein